MAEMDLRVILLLLVFVFPSYAQENLDLDSIRTELKSLSKKKIPGLKETIDYSVSGLNLKEFLRAIAEASSLNMHIAEDITGRVSNNFNGESTMNILLFLIGEFDLGIKITGTIISVFQNKPVIEKKNPKPGPLVSYSPYDDHLSIDSKNDTLSLLLKLVIQQSGKNVVPAPNIADKLVSGFISEMIFDAAIEKFAFANGLTTEKTRDGSILIFQAQLLSEETSPTSSRSNYQGKKFNQNPRYSKNLFQLDLDLNSDPILIDAELDEAPIFDVLQELALRSDKNYIFFSSPQGKINLKVKAVEHDQFLNYLLQGSNCTYSFRDDVYLIGERQREGLRSSELVQFKYRSVEDLLETIPTELSREVEIKVFEELNGLLISGSKPRIEEIKQFIGPLDRLVPLILIELVAIDVRKGRDVETGIKTGISDSVKTGGTLLPGLNFTFGSSSINNLVDVVNTKGIINLGKVNPNFYATLQALEKNNHIRIRSTPKLATLNGHEASLTIGQTEYYLEQTQNIQGGNNLVTTVTPQYREINADLNIMIDPLVSAGNHVTLDILAEFSTFTDPFVLNGPPGKSTRRFESIVRVRNEEMIVLGGLEELRKTRQTEGVPFLSRLPVLKWLFSSVNQEKGESRLLVFIKPTIVY